MPKKLTLQDVQKFILDNDLNRDCELLSTEYVGATTPLTFLCNSCGETFFRDWAHLKRGRFLCSACANAKKAKSNITIETVKEYIEKHDTEHDCTLLSSEYLNSNTPLLLLCNRCGREFKRDFAHIQRGRFRCPQCGMTEGAKKLKYTEEEVDNEIAKRGYRRIGPYINADLPFEAVCKRGHSVNLRFTHFLVGHSGCKKCADIEHTGELSPNWRGGESEVLDTLRKAIFEWKQNILYRDDYRCAATGQHEDLVVHHIIGFNNIVKEASLLTNIPVLKKISEYEDINDFYILERKVKELHTMDKGITLCKAVHNKFHNIYGKGDNNREQFEEFIENYY